jgi:hypothetical protein
VSAALTIGILSQMYGLKEQFPAQLLFFSKVICIILVFFACKANIWNHCRKQNVKTSLVMLGVLAVSAALIVGILSLMYGLKEKFPAQLLFFVQLSV